MLNSVVKHNAQKAVQVALAASSLRQHLSFGWMRNWDPVGHRHEDMKEPIAATPQINKQKNKKKKTWKTKNKNRITILHHPCKILKKYSTNIYKALFRVCGTTLLQPSFPKDTVWCPIRKKLFETKKYAKKRIPYVSKISKIVFLQRSLGLFLSLTL